MKRSLLFLTVFFSIAVFGCKCNEPTIRSSFESADFVYSIEFKSPDKIINELKLEKKQVLAENEQFKIYLIILGVLLTVSLVILVLKRKKN